jgi:hypothetical protein
MKIGERFVPLANFLPVAKPFGYRVDFRAVISACDASMGDKAARAFALE